jgi:hypothetical protein
MAWTSSHPDAGSAERCHCTPQRNKYKGSALTAGTGAGLGTATERELREGSEILREMEWHGFFGGNPLRE